ncbi:hypothetical protein [Xanthobacter versatilis]|uniref:hypothetical protein n=1 Tax=Xanthobacter autotrophicus (strain ATCC BAA-1158 / Py2) TaxID=78245 RepID=UPI0002EE279A
MRIEQHTEQELYKTRLWLEKLLNGLINANRSAEDTAVRIYRAHGPRIVPHFDQEAGSQCEMLREAAE